MITDFPLHLTELDRIHFDDDTFLIRFPFDPTDQQALARSFREVGVLQPVVLRETGHGFQVVDGFRRVAAAYGCEMAQIPAFLLPPQTSDLDCLRIIMQQRQGIATFNDIEIGHLFLRLKNLVGLHEPNIVATAKTLLDLDISPKIARELMAIAQLDDACKALIASEALPRKTARLFLVFTPDEQRTLADFFSAFRLGRNKIRELLVWIDEICRRDEIDLPQLIERAAISDLRADENTPLPQRAGEARDRIRRLRYPTLSTHEARFQELSRSLKLPPYINLTPPPFFEGDRLDMRFQFKNRQQLEVILQKLQEMGEGTAIDEILDLI